MAVGLFSIAEIFKFFFVLFGKFRIVCFFFSDFFSFVMIIHIIRDGNFVCAIIAVYESVAIIKFGNIDGRFIIRIRMYS